MPERIVVVGAGGFGRETLDVIEAINGDSATTIWSVVGVVDDAPSELDVERLMAREYDLLGGVSEVIERFSVARYVISIGDPSIRSAISSRFIDAGWAPATLVHPRAVIGSIYAIGAGSVVCGGVQLSTNTRLGEHVHLNPGAIVGHDTNLADYASVNPGAVVSGDVTVGVEALIGAGAVVLQGLQVGARAVVGANACVTTDVPDSAVVKGVPAR